MRSARAVEYRSSGRNGFSSAVTDHPGCIEARKIAREVRVRFAPEACVVETPEGSVQAQAGDAIITGTAGECWPVSRGAFAVKYRAVPPTVAGQAGTYASMPNRIAAVLMAEPFAVLLADGVSRLTGQAGDWLVDYGDGSLGVVSGPVFASTYAIVS